MIESIQFKNFKVLRDTTLPLGRFTLIVGPNGSGKSTALQGLIWIGGPANMPLVRVATAGAHIGAQNPVEVTIQWPDEIGSTISSYDDQGAHGPSLRHTPGITIPVDELNSVRAFVRRIRLYAFEGSAIGEEVQLRPQIELAASGRNLAGVLDRLRDQHPERFEDLNEELCRWIPEFERVLFDTPREGHRSILLRTRTGQHSIAATDLSQGTLLALAILTIAYLPEPPPLVCFEEPDRGLHPRLLRDVRDALYRLAYPENFGESRQAVQVVATTHSPIFLDLFRDHPKEIVIAEKVGQEGRFSRLTDRPDIDEILEGTSLGEAWYSGVLGGVPGG